MSEYYMFHKPRGCVTARRDERHKTVMDYFPPEKRDVLFPVGRLDKDTEGLLLVTDDGVLCYHLLMPENEVSKTYFFWAQGLLTEEKCREVEGGVKIYQFDPGFIHAKTFVCDDKFAVVGTINLDYRSLYLHFENNVLMYNCEAVRQMEADFVSLFPLCREVTAEYSVRGKRFLRTWQCILRLFAPMV